ncbi:Transcription elongation factor, GreA/GreB family [Pontibacter lucknowensis]|uniref:Transcription elongation factor, GreA/GreB family n=2 Tax=Hymenobacteraceae TaxID=1853232 RepID=A0A1N6WH10_9BACT|nr:Transcription elongation factor, GreA/GreB family [Pontibacter lucknowensis]
MTPSKTDRLPDNVYIMMTLTQELELKKKLLQESTRLLNMQIQAAKEAMDEAQESANEHHGAIEDKFESFREACQIQRDMYARQLDELITTMGVLKRVNSTKENKEVSFGAVVMTELQNYFIGVSLGEMKIDGESFYAISGMSPLYKAMAGKTSGETFVFRDKTYKVLQVF